jgi:hypothetical protein
LKKDSKVMEFLKQNKIPVYKHMWNEDDYCRRTLGIFTNVDTAIMASEYATKVIKKQLKHTVKKQKPILSDLDQ